jgi:S-adenosyl-L-methionine hydrolase (adenosine-forming)
VRPLSAVMLVTFTTDFGAGSSYAAALKGALLAVNPAARPIDLTHDLPPQNLVATGYFLADTLPWFPPGTTHVVVVDPGVGTERALLCVAWHGNHLLVPDNGCWTPLVRDTDPPPVVHRLTEARYWRPRVSASFHGRDVLAPVAGHLSLGVPPAELGPRVTTWERLRLPQPVELPDGIRGEVVIVDHFGNLVTNIPAHALPSRWSVRLPGGEAARSVRTYGEAEPGVLVALTGSSGRLEVAVVNGSAAARLGLGVGAVFDAVRGG